jgi:hypothetical protein
MNETNQPNLNTEETERPPTFGELAESSSGFISAKNYSKGQKVSFQFSEIDKMHKSEKYGNWQCVYIVSKDGEQKRYGMSGTIAKTLKDQYKVMDYKDVLGKTITFLVTKTSQGGNSFEVIDLK